MIYYKPFLAIAHQEHRLLEAVQGLVKLFGALHLAAVASSIDRAYAYLFASSLEIVDNVYSGLGDKQGPPNTDDPNMVMPRLRPNQPELRNGRNQKLMHFLNRNMDYTWILLNAIATFLGWKAAHCRIECDIDSPESLWKRVLRVVTR